MSQRKAKQARRAQRAVQAPAKRQSKRSFGGSKAAIGISLGIVAVAAIVAVGVLRAGGGSGVVSVSGSNVTSLEGTDPVNGTKVTIADYVGKPVVINIWASWCPGCIEEAADLARFAKDHPEAQVLGIDYQDTKGEAKDFHERWRWTWPSIFDPDGDLAASLGLQGLPMTLFLNAEHRVVGQIVGAGTYEQFEQGLRRA